MKCANNNADQSVVCGGFMSPFGIASACLELKGGDTRYQVHNICPIKNQKKTRQVELIQYYAVEKRYTCAV